MPADFTYSPAGEFIAIMPETPAAEAAWRETIAPQTSGTGKILPAHFPAVKLQLRAAGFTIRKAAAPRVSDADLLRELGASE